MNSTSTWVTAAMALALAAGCGGRGSEKSGLARLGYEGGPHAAMVYVAEDRGGKEGAAFEGVPFGSSGDVGYALISGGIDAGFIETSKAAALFRAVSGLRAVGAITYPYGATLVLRKDLDLRLDDLAGRRVAVAGRGCRLLHQFAADAGRLGVETAGMTFVPMPFDQMIPALEAGKVDAILTRGGHALLAVGEGHPVLYQNWNVEGGDECCPKTLAQIELILVARADGARGSRLRDVVSALELGSSVSAGELRAAAARRTRIPLAALEPFPVASFVALTPEQQAELGGGALEEEADEHDHDCEHEGCSAATHQNGD